MSTPTVVPWVQYNEYVVGQNHPTLADVVNRPGEFLISQSDLDPSVNFPGFLGRYLNAGSPETAVAANIGVACFDTTNGDLYIKKTGTGNTGWQMVGGSSSVAAGTTGKFSKFLSATKVGDSLVSETTGVTLAVGASGINWSFTGATVTEAASGTHPYIVGLKIDPPTITAGAATVTDAATVYISGAPTGTFTHNSRALWVGGLTHIEGQIVHGASTVTVTAGVNAMFCGLNITAVNGANNCFGWDVEPTFTVSASGTGSAVLYAQLHTAASAITIANGIGLMIDSASKGAGSTITTLYGIKVLDQTAGGTNYAIFTGLGLVKFGDAVIIGTDPGGTDLLRVGGNITINNQTGNPQITWMQGGANKYAIYQDSVTGEFKIYNYGYSATAFSITNGLFAINQQTSIGPHCQLNWRINGVDKWAIYALNEDGSIRIYNYGLGGDAVIFGSTGKLLTFPQNGSTLAFTSGAGYNSINFDTGAAIQIIAGGGSGDVDLYLQASGNSGANIRLRTGGTSDRWLFRGNGTFANQAAKVTINNTGFTNIGTASNGSLYILHDQTSGGAALVLADSSGLQVVAQLGATSWAVTTTPTATQIGLQFSAANLQAKGGSSRTNEVITWAQIQFDW